MPTSTLHQLSNALAFSAFIDSLLLPAKPNELHATNQFREFVQNLGLAVDAA